MLLPPAAVLSSAAWAVALRALIGLHIHSLGGCCSSWLMRAVRHQRSYLTTCTTSTAQSTNSIQTSSSSETALSGGVVLPSLFLTTSSSSSTYTRCCLLYDVFDQEKEKKKKNISTSGMIHLPREMDLHLIIGSSDGFLFTFDRCTQEIYAINPLTESRLLLPSTASIPNMIGVLRSATSDEVTHYVIQDDEPRIERYLYEGKGKGKGKESNINSFLFQRVDPTSTTDAHKLMHKYDYYEKAILSPSLDTAVVIRELDTDSERQLAFAPVGLQTSADHSFWTPLHKSTKSPVTEGFIDIIFHQGRLHALDKSGSLTIFDLDNPSSPPLYRSPAGKPLEEEEEGKYGHENGYLVESPDGRDLFVVYRGILQYDKDGMCTPPRTNTFKVFKLDTRSSDYFSKWERVESIGDLAFFLGCNRSSSLSTLDFPPGHIKPNSIYFTDTCYTGDYEDEIGDTGVFSLEDGTFKFYPINDENHKFNETRPVWLMPPTIGSS